VATFTSMERRRTRGNKLSRTTEPFRYGASGVYRPSPVQDTNPDDRVNEISAVELASWREEVSKRSFYAVQVKETPELSP
jgi:hypothetical protein